MKVALQNKDTGMFFAEGGKWVTQIDHAILFRDSVEAEARFLKESLSHVQIRIITHTGNDIILRCCQGSC